ncbi:MAG: SPOR domain-containing protein [Candidatus Margulisiibacteriota bacterium]
MEDQNQNPAPEQIEESKVMHDIPRRNRFFSFIKSLFVFSLLAVIIVGSFWVSFNLGKKILVPVKKNMPNRIEAAIPEPPVSIVDLQEMDKIADKILEDEKASAVKQQPKPKTSRKIAYKAPKPRYSSPSVKHYKVQAGLFSNKTSALNLARKLRAQGIEAFARSVSEGWRVQAGAYESKQWAQKQQSSLKAKGFDSTLVHE